MNPTDAELAEFAEEFGLEQKAFGEAARQFFDDLPYTAPELHAMRLAEAIERYVTSVKAPS